MEPRYRTETDNGVVTIWDDSEGIGIRFTEGETLQGYLHSAVITDDSILTTEEGIKKMDEVVAKLLRQAEKDYPKEFAPLKG